MEATGANELSPEQEDALVEAAWAAREHAYAPYSNYQVGAAVMSDDGTIFAGCNVENAVYGATMCAERIAVGRAVAGGKRRLLAVVVVTEGHHPATPCGTCRQVLAEFGPRMQVLIDNRRSRRRFRLDALLPEAFTRAQLDAGAGAPGNPPR